MFLGTGGPCCGLDLPEKIIDISFNPRAYVIHPRALCFECKNVRADDIFYEHVVARLRSFAVDEWLLPFQHLRGKDGHNAGFSFGILARPIDIRVAQARRRKPVDSSIVEQVRFRREFRNAVRRDGPGGVPFIGREVVLFPVNGTSAGGEQNAPHSRFHCGLEDRQNSDDIHGGVIHRIGNGSPDVHLGRMMIHHIEPSFTEAIPNAVGITEIRFMERRTRVDILLAPRREIVKDRDVVPSLQICIDDVGGNEPCAASNENLHVVPRCCRCCPFLLCPRTFIYPRAKKERRSPRILLQQPKGR